MRLDNTAKMEIRIVIHTLLHEISLKIFILYYAIQPKKKKKKRKTEIS